MFLLRIDVCRQRNRRRRRQQQHLRHSSRRFFRVNSCSLILNSSTKSERCEYAEHLSVSEVRVKNMLLH